MAVISLIRTNAYNINILIIMNLVILTPLLSHMSFFFNSKSPVKTEGTNVMNITIWSW